MSTEAAMTEPVLLSGQTGGKTVPAGKLSVVQLSALAAPGILSAVMQGPMASVLPTLYAQRFGLNMAVIGSILLVSRIFDAVIDPVIGYLSDITRSPIGSRKPWLIAGSALATIALYKLYVPGGSAGANYFLGWSLAIFFAWTLSEIPFNAWTLELSRDTNERARIFGYRTFAVYIGGIIIAVAPELVPGSGGQMTFGVLKALSVGVILAIPLATAACVYFVPRGEVSETARPHILELYRSIRGNIPFLTIIGTISVSAWQAASMVSCLSYI